MKILKYMFVIAMVAMMTACGDNDPELIADDLNVSAKVLNVSYGTAQIQITAPVPVNYTEGQNRPFELLLEGNGDKREVYIDDYYDWCQIQIEGGKIIATVQIEHLEPGCEYTLFYMGRFDYKGDSQDRNYYNGDLGLPLIELLKFKTTSIEAATILKPQVIYSFADDNSVILRLKFPQPTALSKDYKYLVSTNSDMSNPMIFNIDNHGGFDKSDIWGIGIGGLLKPGTKYYFQIQGSFYAYYSDYDNLYYENYKTVPVEFTTSNRHIGLFDGVHVSITYETYAPYINSDYMPYSKNHFFLDVNLESYVNLYTSSDYQTKVEELEVKRGEAYYPLCVAGFISGCPEQGEFYLLGITTSNPAAVVCK